MRLPMLLLLLGFAEPSRSCLEPDSAYRFTGAVCRLTYPAASVLNEKTTNVIEAAFQYARYPDMKGEKELLFMGTLHYGLKNLEIYNLSIGGSEVELHAGDHIAISVSNVIATFRAAVEYGYGNRLFNFGSSVDFEIESHISLFINPKLYCRNEKVMADTTDCHLTFHQLKLILQGDREPGWLKKLFTDFVTFTVKMVVRSQICKEINKLANILAAFIQGTSETFLSNGDIGVDISVTAAPVLTSNYIESYHKGLTYYRNMTAVINASVFNPTHLTEDRMIYFWISDELLEPLVKAVHLDGRFQCNITATELTDLFKVNLQTAMPAHLEKLLSSEAPVLRVWSVSTPSLWTSPQGTSVRGTATVELAGSPDSLTIPTLFFKTEVEVLVRASYTDKKLILNVTQSFISIVMASVSPESVQVDSVQLEYLREAVEKIGVPKIISYLESGITALLNKQGLDLFEIINPIVLPQQGYIVVQMDFGFPHHLFVGFLKKTLESSSVMAGN